MKKVCLSIKGFVCIVLLCFLAVGFASVEVRASGEWSVNIDAISRCEDDRVEFLEGIEFALYENGVRVDTRTTSRSGHVMFIFTGQLEDFYIHLIESGDYLPMDELFIVSAYTIVLEKGFQWWFYPPEDAVPLTPIPLNAFYIVYIGRVRVLVHGIEFALYENGIRVESQLSDRGYIRFRTYRPIENLSVHLIDAGGLYSKIGNIVPATEIVGAATTFQWEFYPRGTSPEPPPPALNLTTASPWAHADLTRAITLNLVPTTLQSNYTQATTRAEFAALAVALYESIIGEITGRTTFTDTNDINVEKLAYLGVVSGVGDGRFAPDNQLTREQAAALVTNLAEAIGHPFSAAAPTFADNASISYWARDGVGSAQAAGIMGGVGDNRFYPQGSYTREQSIITMLRLLDFAENS